MAELFGRTAGPVATTATIGSFWRGLRLVAWDGMQLEVADTPANAAGFGYLHARRGRSGYPLVRLVALVECGTRAILDAALGAYATAEKALAQQLLSSLCPGMLLLADRNFDGYELWGQAKDPGADLLWRAKGVRILPCRTALPDGSYLSYLPRRNKSGYRYADGHQVRVIEFHVTVATSDGASRTEHYRLLTTLTDHRRYPADLLAALYHQRWEVEIAYFGLKVTLRTADRVLRSQSPDGVEQEIYAYLIIYQVLRRVMHHSARRIDLDPDRISMTVAVRAARHSIIAADQHNPSPGPDGPLHHALTSEVLPPRRADRVSPRAVKRPISPFSYKQIKSLRESRTARRATYTISLRNPASTHP
ncbi:IS4 family transposase [Streptomyces sp. V4I8]|uniref:IS4 family transposase n=1 Tax=Streptomyces sp. V4I8 TaxID=3156469 RepID=UPI0035194523